MPVDRSPQEPQEPQQAHEGLLDLLAPAVLVAHRDHGCRARHGDPLVPVLPVALYYLGLRVHDDPLVPVDRVYRGPLEAQEFLSALWDQVYPQDQDGPEFP